MSLTLHAAEVVRALAPNVCWTRSRYGFAAEAPSTDLLAQVPQQYVAFLEALEPGEGFLGVSFLRLYPLDELTAVNREYHVGEFLPACQLFGSDGSGNAYLFDFGKRPPEIIRVPFIPLDRKFASPLGTDFLGFVQAFATVPQGYRGPLPPRPNPETAGKEIHEIHPVVLGGDPTSQANKVLITPPQHAQASTYFNRLVRKMRERQGS